jgi:hypothetical protein
VKTTLPVPIFYPVLSDFTPYSIAKKDQTIYGNLVLQQIVFLVPGDYLQGQVCYWDPSVGGDSQLHVINENLTVGSQIDVAALITQGKISGIKTYSAWTVGNSYQETTGGGVYDPQIIEYDYAADEFIPSPASIIPLNQRPGAFVWVVGQNFTLQPATNNITGAQTAFKLGTSVVPKILEPGTSYSIGNWVYTPQIGSGPNPVADPYFNYVDVRLGVVNKYAYVEKAFTYEPNGQTISVYFDDLAEQDIVKEIVVTEAKPEYDPILAVVLEKIPVYKYKPRFPAGAYLEYRQDSSAVAEYYIAAKYFTPTSTNAQDLVNQGLVFPLYTDSVQYSSLVLELEDPNSPVKKPTRMFRFFQGDRTFFRQGSQVISYTATTNVHPLFEFYIYLQNGVFVETGRYLPSQFESIDYIPYFDPAYVEYSEDTVLSVDGRNIYRVMFAFTPPETVVNWTNTTVVNTARNEEYAGNLLRYVDQYVCEEAILSQLGRDISAIKLGIAQITVIPKNKGRFANSQEQALFVWENTATLTEVPQLSWSSGTTYPYSPPDYGTGTLKL